MAPGFPAVISMLDTAQEQKGDVSAMRLFTCEETFPEDSQQTSLHVQLAQGYHVLWSKPAIGKGDD